VKLFVYSEGRKPDLDIIVYCKEVIKSGHKPRVDWPTLLGMYKHYLSKGSKDQWFQYLRECLVVLFGEETISHIDEVGGANDKL
jgi:hypothetical protein